MFWTPQRAARGAHICEICLLLQSLFWGGPKNYIVYQSE